MYEAVQVIKRKMNCAPGLVHYERLTVHRAVVSVVQGAFSKRLVKRFMEKRVERGVCTLKFAHWGGPLCNAAYRGAKGGS